MGHHPFEGVELAGEPTGKTVRQQTEGLVGGRTVVPRDPHSRRRLARVRAMAGEPAATRRMAWTPIQPCVVPGLLGKIRLAGQRTRIAQLHRPRGARLAPWRTPSPFPVARWLGRRGRSYYSDVRAGYFEGGARRHPQSGRRAPTNAAERPHNSRATSWRISHCAQGSAISSPNDSEEIYPRDCGIT